MIEQLAQIVCAYLRKNQVASGDIPTVIASVNAAISRLGQPVAEAAPELVPAVSIRRSVSAERLVCLSCGWGGKMLKRHLDTSHDLTPQEYRARWGLAGDYPMVAPNYAARRSALAKQIGLGQGARGRRAKISAA